MTGLSDSIKERFAYIEHMLRWYGGVTARQIGEVFGIERVNAQRVIARYRKVFSGAIRYDSSLKKQVADNWFDTHFIKATPRRFLDHLRGQRYVRLYRETGDREEISDHDTDSLAPLNLKDEIVSVIVQALSEERVLKISYHSINRVSDRLISPNQIVYTNHRFHLRAFCHQKQEYQDFVLGRVLLASLYPKPTIPEMEMGQAIEWISGSSDKSWNQIIDLIYQINPEIPVNAKGALRLNYNVDSEDHLIISCREAFRYYIVDQFKMIDHRFHKPLWIALKS